MLNRQGLFFELMEELLSQLRVNGQDIHVERLLKLVELNTNKGFLIKLSREGTWLMEWSVAVDVDETSDSRDVFAVVFKGGWENIVPWFVAQYLHSGILLYKHRRTQRHLR